MEHTFLYPMSWLSYANSVLVACGEVFRLVSYIGIYVTSYDDDSHSYYGYFIITEFDDENARTNATHYVASESVKDRSCKL